MAIGSTIHRESAKACIKTYTTKPQAKINRNAVKAKIMNRL